MSPISRAERPAELLAVVEALDLALRRLGDVDAVLVEEADHHRLRVVRRTSRTVMPARLARRGTWNRVTGTVATSRSSTFTPAALQPTMTARFSTRAARLVSREAVMVAPFSNVRGPRHGQPHRPARG